MLDSTHSLSPEVHRFGVNYVPSKDWWYCWNSWNADDLRADLDAVAALGTDHLRIMLMWHFFQPNSRWVSPAHLDRLEEFMVLARERGLDVCPTLLNGWLTGSNHLPPFDKGDAKTFYSPGRMRDAQDLYFTEVAARLRCHKNLMAVDLGNEMNCCWGDRTSTELGDAWSHWAVARWQALLPGTLVVHGVDHGPWFEKHTFSPECLAHLSPVLTLHCWNFFTRALDRGGPLDPPSLHLKSSMAALARWHAGDPAKPVWIQEFGASEEWMSAEVIPDFLEQSMEFAVRHGVNWFTWWASHDIDRKLGVKEAEYSMGLITVENQLKPAAHVFKRLADKYRGRPVAAQPVLLTHPPALQEKKEVWQWLEEWSDAVKET